MNKVPTPFGYVIFCDDVRNETTGKEIFVGVYKEKIVVSELPATLPRLFAVVHYIETAGENDEPVFIEITTPDSDPDKPIIVQELPAGILRERVAKGTIPKDARLTIRGHFEFPFLALTKEGDLVVTAKTAGKELELGRLGVKLAPTTD